ncbi:MAG: acetyl-CoA carboxylase biotin carboxylase subunit [Alicyclobacillus macrosporangiidus]|uniref:acetyl-CoA carboxylase biotin carboxylase subunit n=1 Tax=Alicyclobacillus macrosporangiidus TaxID=392015 RepID=UPI0026EFD910|nr:acetyl-CoA carboxylase biotin carboxylase subunit [Alicyclobacillus macrosporangiidus]MCL6599064.1 acetyl-CoA carboxylase biotin carboxylase subunit [Alicyclobacillus macrosporangiidus]
MVQKLLIANRGEIARRILRTCRRLGVATVAVYSDADSDAPHVQEADEAVRIGPPPVAQSYLRIEAILDAARQTGADAVHPGYGFLSENPGFAQACRDAGLVFVGPSPEAIAAMGSKVEARQRLMASGVPVVPGTEAGLASLEEALEAAERLGYPVMVKASAGGGGIGMQVVDGPEALTRAFSANAQRAQAYFGDGTLFLEKRIRPARHIEIQVLFDGHGHGVYLWERECSIQRRHQKVMEEAPSPFVDDPLRQRMGEAAMAAASAIGYVNAGTVEFLVDAERRFYFLEMNTRLQVEHPVTEMITGLDLVEWQLRVASGEPLPFRQEDLRCEGHAIECRVYAEDPVRMLPSPGTITRLALPEGDGVRNDVGVVSGSKVTPYYDAMIGKLIVHGRDRAEAVHRLRRALDAYVVEGIQTNLPLLRRIASSQAFSEGQTTTDFIASLQNEGSGRTDGQRG